MNMPKWLQVVESVLPLVLAAIGINPMLVPIVTAGIGEAEALFGPGTGDQKKQHVLNLTNDTVAAVNTAAGKEVVNPAEVSTTVSSGIDTAVGVANLVAGK